MHAIQPTYSNYILNVEKSWKIFSSWSTRIYWIRIKYRWLRCALCNRWHWSRRVLHLMFVSKMLDNNYCRLRVYVKNKDRYTFKTQIFNAYILCEPNGIRWGSVQEFIFYTRKWWKKNAETMSCNNHARILHGMRLLVFRRKKREDEGRFEIN